MISDEVIVEAARECIDAPWRHQGRTLEEGLDCIGILIYVARRIGIRLRDRTNYPRRPDGKTLIRELDAQLQPLGGHVCNTDHGPCREAHDLTLAPGRIVIFSTRKTRLPIHVGIVTPWPHGGLGMVHVYLDVGRCVEAPLDDFFLPLLHKVYEWPGRAA